VIGFVLRRTGGCVAAGLFGFGRRRQGKALSSITVWGSREVLAGRCSSRLGSGANPVDTLVGAPPAGHGPLLAHARRRRRGRAARSPRAAARGGRRVGGSDHTRGGRADPGCHRPGPCLLPGQPRPSDLHHLGARRSTTDRRAGPVPGAGVDRSR
jgi:hypothetical protein